MNAIAVPPKPKRLQLDRTVPMDDLGFEVLNNLLMFGQISRNRDVNDKFDLHEYSMAILERMCDGKGVTRRILQKYQARVNMKVLKDEKIIIFTQFKLNNPGSIRRVEITSVKCVEIRWRYTDRGNIYFCYPEKSRLWYLYPSHFFDRFVERGLDEDVPRAHAVGKFLWHVMHRDTNRLYINSDDYTAIFYCDEGAGLGHLRIASDKDNLREYPVMLFKTFIGRDMLTQNQLRIEQELGYPVPAVDYETFDNYER